MDAKRVLQPVSLQLNFYAALPRNSPDAELKLFNYAKGSALCVRARIHLRFSAKKMSSDRSRGSQEI